MLVTVEAVLLRDMGAANVVAAGGDGGEGVGGGGGGVDGLVASLARSAWIACEEPPAILSCAEMNRERECVCALQCVAVCCSVLQSDECVLSVLSVLRGVRKRVCVCVAVCCSVLQSDEMCAECVECVERSE